MRSTTLALMLLLPPLIAQQWPGPRPDGTTLLPNGWSLRPHGRQVPLPSDLPVRLVLHPRAPFLAVQHAGFRRHRVVILHASRETVRLDLPLPRTWSGMDFSPAGDRLYVSGGADDTLHVFAFDPRGPKAEEVAVVPLGDPEHLELPAGLATAPDGSVFVPLQRSARLLKLDRDAHPVFEVPLPHGTYPFECRVTPNGRAVWVSLWGAGRVLALSAATGEVLADVRVGEHPSEMLLSPDGRRLFVSNGNENTVSVVDTERGRVEEVISSALHPGVPPGSTPDSLALSPDGGILLVANADNNNCAAIDVSRRGRSRGLGFIPLGWYPTSIRFARDGGKVFAANGKGSGGSRRNPGGPRPQADWPRNLAEYSGAMFGGSLSIFPFPKPEELQRLSAAAKALSPCDRTPPRRPGARWTRPFPRAPEPHPPSGTASTSSRRTAPTTRCWGMIRAATGTPPSASSRGT